MLRLQNIILRIFLIPFALCIFYNVGHGQALTNEKKSNDKINYIPYYLKVYEADELYKIAEFEKCFSLLDSLFSKYEPLNQDLYYEYEKYISSAVSLNKKLDYHLQVRKLISHFGYDKNTIELNPLLLEAYNLSNINDVDYEKMRNNYVTTKNLTLRDTIIEIYNNDQYYRTNKLNMTKKDSLEHLFNIDEENGKKLVYIFNKYGYPNSNIIGNRTLRGKREKVSIDPVIVHMADQTNKEFFKKKILDFVIQGTCSPSVYATLIDREKLNNGEEQIYYSFYSDNISYDRNIVNARRKEIGLNNIIETSNIINH